MKFINATAALFAGLAGAAPSTKNVRTSSVTLTFWAAADITFDVVVPIDGDPTRIHSDLSFTQISARSPGGTICHAHGIDGSETLLYDSASGVPIGPPQVQVTATCSYY